MGYDLTVDGNCILKHKVIRTIQIYLENLLKRSTTKLVWVVIVEDKEYLILREEIQQGEWNYPIIELKRYQFTQRC